MSLKKGDLAWVANSPYFHPMWKDKTVELIRKGGAYWEVMMVDSYPPVYGFFSTRDLIELVEVEIGVK